MRTMRRHGRFQAPAGAAALLLLSLAGCGGGGGNNDQGVVFRATGMFRGREQIDQGRITCTIPNVSDALVDAAYDLSLSQVIAFPNRAQVIANPCGGFIGLQNNLDEQSINVQEISITYEIPGATVAIPPTSVTFGQTILPATSDQETQSGQPNLVYSQLQGQIVPRNLIVFLNVNANRLPATPYLMNVFLVARGQSDDGTNYESNQIGYQLTMVQ